MKVTVAHFKKKKQNQNKPKLSREL